MIILCGYVCLKGHQPGADLRYWREDNFGASTFIYAAIESKLRI